MANLSWVRNQTKVQKTPMNTISREQFTLPRIVLPGLCPGARPREGG